MLEKEENIVNKIYVISGKQIMLDSDLAELYKCKNGTKEVNQAVKNNPLKFPERFSWILSDLESEELLVKNFDQKIIDKRGGKYKNPRVFTEQGVAMLATILKSAVATQMSIKIMDAFVAMRYYIGDTELRLSNVETKVIEHDNNIKLLQETFKNFEDNRKNNEVYFRGKVYDAYSKVLDIFKEAKYELIIVDRYTDKTILDMIKELNVKVVLITGRSTEITKLDIEKYNSTYNNLCIYYSDIIHDRYIVIDENTMYHSGNSLNHIGFRGSSIDVINDKSAREGIMNDIHNIIKKEIT